MPIRSLSPSRGSAVSTATLLSLENASVGNVISNAVETLAVDGGLPEPLAAAALSAVLRVKTAKGSAPVLAGAFGIADKFGDSFTAAVARAVAACFPSIVDKETGERSTFTPADFGLSLPAPFAALSSGSVNAKGEQSRPKAGDVLAAFREHVGEMDETESKAEAVRLVETLVGTPDNPERGLAARTAAALSAKVKAEREAAEQAAAARQASLAAAAAAK